MSELLQHLFELVCSQPAGRTWSLRGEWLPFCERCTGLYIGAIAALALQLILRIQPGSSLLAVYGLLMVQMAPFGLRLLPETGITRTLSDLTANRRE